MVLRILIYVCSYFAWGHRNGDFLFSLQSNPWPSCVMYLICCNAWDLGKGLVGTLMIMPGGDHGRNKQKKVGYPGQLARVHNTDIARF